MYTSHLLRRSYREDGKVRHENLGNLSHLPTEIIDVIRAMLAGRRLVDLDEDFEITRSLPHGHVAAVLGVLRDLDLERLISRDRCRERDLVVAMIVQRLIGPGSKLSATRRFSQTTLGDELSLGDVSEAELLAAMDWLVERQPRIERTLARRHLPGEKDSNAFVLYDLSSSYMEGRCCPLARLGYSRDGVKGKLQVNYGLICSPEMLEFSSALAREHGATVVISVPNDAFWAIKNPYHLASWGEGAFEELRALLPAEHTLLRQVALTGSAMVAWDAPAETHELAVTAGGEGTVATHFIAAFGPRHRELRSGALALQADMAAQRRWERQRENDLALMQKVAGEHEAEVQALDEKIVEQREELRERTVWFEEWRTYIHELERELGRPPAGSPEAMEQERSGAGTPPSSAEPPVPPA